MSVTHWQRAFQEPSSGNSVNHVLVVPCVRFKLGLVHQAGDALCLFSSHM